MLSSSSGGADPSAFCRRRRSEVEPAPNAEEQRSHCVLARRSTRLAIARCLALQLRALRPTHPASPPPPNTDTKRIPTAQGRGLRQLTAPLRWRRTAIGAAALRRAGLPRPCPASAGGQADMYPLDTKRPGTLPHALKLTSGA